MSDDIGPKSTTCQWVITHDTELRHFFLEFHLSEKITPAEFLEELSALVETYAENPDELFDGSEPVSAQ